MRQQHPDRTLRDSAPPRTSAPSARARLPARSPPRHARSAPRTASALPDAAAVISGVVPCSSVELASAPALSSSPIIAALPFFAAMNSGVMRAQPRRGLHVRARRQQHFRHLQVVVKRGPVQRRRAVALRRVHVGFLRQQRSTAFRSPVCAASASRVSAAASRHRRKRTAPTADLCRHGCLRRLNRDFARAVADALHVHPHFVHHGQQHVRHRRRILRSARADSP